MSTFSEFMKEREKAAAAYCQGDGEPVLALSTAREPASFFGPDGKVLQFGRDGESRFEVHQTAEAGDIAYWSGVQRAIVELGGRRVPMDLRVTELFRREDEAWKLVHRHADILKSGE
ncbi:YybH family protein [Kumtagia ephedrae]|uniref:DUF4440 domain-containing protein n=1 Tax=Kumtagia ephedrae TaxID=2116701 RepID=A0A2P7SLN6_9HYPH|nr:nuclear transport factor 2 family protein [Mesorhizobium ephedrae]PSJ63406.1 DUF4440 domain-containing protein [Mesorhizobium ephedrae]